jgi:hypothetical protein
MKRILLICSLFLLTMVSVSETYACSGGAPFSAENLPSMDVIVYATVVDVDDRGYNAVLRIDRYFKGQGRVYAAVMRWEPGLEVASDVRGYSTGCWYDGGGTQWIAGSEGYFALRDRGNGTFTDDIGYQTAPHYFVNEGAIQVYRHDDYSTLETQSVPQFEQLLLDVGEKAQASKPEGSSDYPLMRFLNITTESGTRYRLNPDRSLTPLDPKNDPIAISPDGAHIAFRNGGDSIRLLYPFDPFLPVKVLGKRIQFSPDSNLAAIWDERGLTIYIFDNYLHAGSGGQMSLQTVGIADLQTMDSQQFAQVAWSGDSTTVVFQDARGLWSWNVFEQAEPTLIVPLYELGAFSLLEASRSGRYVRYGDDAQWMLIDTETGERHPDAIASPDERNLIYINAENPPPTLFDLSLMDESYQHQSCTAPIMESCPIVVQREGFQQAFWYKHDQIGILKCGEKFCSISSFSWDLCVNTAPSSQSYNWLPSIRDLAYDEQNDEFVEIIGDYALKVGLFPQTLEYSIVFGTVRDFSEQLDSPIANIEWDQPIFYHEPPTVVQ